MSSASNRPFRHTATIASLEIMLALAELGHSATENRAKILRQAEGEKKSKKVNKTRVRDLEASAVQAGERAAQIQEFNKRWFDAVFVHRYRDVDPRIRVDCVSYLSRWIEIYPEEYLDGAHLRYLGWVLSDTQAMTRLQVVRDIQKIFRDDNKIGGVRQFTERFRPRMVEIAARDGDLNVRCSCIDLLDILRDKGLLEPDDVDVIGKLIFDSEPRVRKAVSPFFAANVEDTYQAKIDDFVNVDEETLHNFERSENDDDVESHKLNWIRFKCVAELLRSYDFTEGGTERLIDLEASAINDTAESIHSRISLATQALFDRLPALQNWESLANYLLKDIPYHDNVQDADVPACIDNTCSLESAEEAVLLDVLNVSVKHALSKVTSDTDHHSKKAKKAKKELNLISEAQESAAQRLATHIPRLLKKFGSQPESTSAVLRLGHLLNLEVFAQLREDSTTYASLLEDINRQFLQHEAATVICSARQALLHAKSFDELQEVTDGKLAALWDDTALTLTRLCLEEEVGVRGNFHASVLNALSATVLRIANLASISDATEPLELSRTARSSNPRRKTGSGKDTPTIPLQCLLKLVSRGVLDASNPDNDLEPEIVTAEDTLVDHALRAVTFYLMWRVSPLQQQSSRAKTRELMQLKDYYTSFQTILPHIIKSRRGADPLRIKAAENLLEVSALFSTLRGRARDDPAFAEALDLPSSIHIPTESRQAILSVFAAAEHDYAKKSNKQLADPTGTDDDVQETQEREQEEIEAEPESSDEGEDDATDNENVDEDGNSEKQRRVEASRQKKQRLLLFAEQSLCRVAGKMVLAIVGGCVEDGGAMRKRLERNRGRLGKNFADVVATLEPPKKERPLTRGKVAKAGKKKTIVDDEGEDEGLMADGPELEEDGEEDLRAREILEETVDREVDADAEEPEEVESALGD